MSSYLVLDDGIIEWYDGPEYDQLAEEAFQQAAREVEEYARATAVWEDRTGDARSGLTAEVSNDGNGTITLSLSHGVDYGYWLEVIQNGRFAIIMRTLEEQAPRIMVQTISKIESGRQGSNF